MVSACCRALVRLFFEASRGCRGRWPPRQREARAGPRDGGGGVEGIVPGGASSADRSPPQPVTASHRAKPKALASGVTHRRGRAGRRHVGRGSSAWLGRNTRGHDRRGGSAATAEIARSVVAGRSPLLHSGLRLWRSLCRGSLAYRCRSSRCCVPDYVSCDHEHNHMHDPPALLRGGWHHRCEPLPGGSRDGIPIRWARASAVSRAARSARPPGSASRKTRARRSTRATSC